MIGENKKAVLTSSVGADERQSSPKITSIVPQNSSNSNWNQDIYNEYLRMQGLAPPLSTFTLTELFDDVYARRDAIIEGLLYPGTYLFAGPPKIGKSFLMAQFAYHISTGTPLWGFPVSQGTVLYFALEDDKPRLQDRFYRMFGVGGSDKLYFVTKANRLGEGLTKQIGAFLTRHPDTRLVIIDTLQKIWDGTDNYNYRQDYELVSQLKELSDGNSFSIMLVHHTRKLEASDQFDRISGTNGLFGSADGGFVIQKEKRTDQEATLSVTGRDQQDQSLLLSRNSETLCWELREVETDFYRDPPEPFLEQVSLFLIEQGGRWEGSSTELKQALRTDLQPNALSQKLNVNANRLLKEYGISYSKTHRHDGRRITLRVQEGC